MKKHRFELPEFLRINWVSNAARELWEPRIARIVKAWIELEWITVREGLRPCASITLSPEDLIKRSAIFIRHGLTIMPVEIEGSVNQYASRTVKHQPGQPYMFRVVIGRNNDLIRFIEAWNTGNNDSLGEMLGYPRCCREFFDKNWANEGLLDTTWPMAKASTPPEGEQDTIKRHVIPETNLIQRWFGVRPVFHLPCSFECKATMAQAHQIRELGQQTGFTEEMDWIQEILTWPVQWSSLHGIAEIKTPLMRAAVSTDATSKKQTVQLTGSSYPEEGAKGVNFPYNQAL